MKVSNNTLCVILGDQLSHSISSLKSINKKSDYVLMAELWDETQYVKHHKKKLVLILSAMRHFKDELLQKDYQVDYYSLTAKTTYDSFTNVVLACLKKRKINKIVITMPGEYRVFKKIQTWEDTFNIPVEILQDTRFLSSPEYFHNWAQDRKQLRMEYFYRELRKEHNILVEDGKPVGGDWNYDTQNRQMPAEGITIPKPTQFSPDTITKSVIALVQQYFGDHFGSLKGFVYAVTRKQALQVLNQFIKQRLPNFGQYQDAMLENQAWMFHAHISFYLNCGLLLPQECIKKAEEAYYKKQAPLNSVEGFIRQILGWREYVRGFYWYVMPDYPQKNYLNAKRKLPDFYWTAKTKLNCLKQSISETYNNAYAHHIQRLMVLGNFALLAGINPDAVNEWYMIVYADAYEWVELPNVSGMTLFADGGLLASKPYAAGGNYIHKMSNYCQQCHYDVKQKTGPDACPFNYLYWNFLVKNQKKLAKNQRLSMIYRTWQKMEDTKKKAIINSAKVFLESLAK